MKLKSISKLTVILLVTTLALTITSCAAREKVAWPVHSMERPKPRVIAAPVSFGEPPEDAIILDATQWVMAKGGGKMKWKVGKDNEGNEFLEVVKKSGYIRTDKSFGSCQLHIEWASPSSGKGKGQKRGNSGVLFMGKYELQVLDSYNNPVYADGQAASMYGQVPPLVNASRGPGEWQSYDVSFLCPIFGPDGKVVRPAVITVFHNGVVVHNNYEIKGFTHHKKLPKYSPHPEKLPISLQDHGDPVRFRNIWVRELSEEISSSVPYVKKDKDK